MQKFRRVPGGLLRNLTKATNRFFFMLKHLL